MKKKQKIIKDISKEFIEMLEKSEEGKRRQHEKELKSLRKKLNGQSLIWFDSLNKTRQFDLLFEWKNEKYWNKREKVEISYRYEYDWANFPKKVKKLIKVYPPNFKHFIKNKMRSNRYKVDKSRMRDTAINSILNDN